LQDDNQQLKDKVKHLEKKLIELSENKSSAAMANDYSKKSSRYVSTIMQYICKLYFCNFIILM